jgi:8-oxo-dGTP pyrophosphatase MutT (NUDIX family)
VRIRLAWFGDKLAQRLADIEAGRIAPAAPRDAATVMVLRPAGAEAPDGAADEAGGAAGAAAGDDRHDPGVEVLMLRRVAAMKFAPGAYVFPGGAVDSADFDQEIGWHGPDPAEFGARLGAPPELARALVCAAVRETFEEAGVLLAGAPDGGPLADPSGPSWEADRAALVAGALTLAELLSRRGLVLRADLLVPWARWITPEGEPRRFDARFFAAALPPGQVATGHAAESDRIAWLRPAAAIAAARAGEMSMLPPTATTLNDFAVPGAAADGDSVADGDAVAEILARRPVIEPVMPRLVLEDGAAWLLVPDEVGYPL